MDLPGQTLKEGAIVITEITTIRGSGSSLETLIGFCEIRGQSVILIEGGGTNLDDIPGHLAQGMIVTKSTVQVAEFSDQPRFFDGSPQVWILLEHAVTYEWLQNHLP